MLIFIAGMHGVGKTYLGKSSSESLNFYYTSASSLIKEKTQGIEQWGMDKHTKNIDQNQEALIEAVNEITSNAGQVLVLDGHFVLKDSRGKLTALSMDVFQRLNVSSVILLEAPSIIISKRLEDRGAPKSIDDIEEMMTHERLRADLICSKLQIPLIKLMEPSFDEFLKTLRTLTTSAN